MIFKEVDIIPAITNGWLFNDQLYNALKPEKFRCFILFDKDKCLARSVFYVDEGIALSGFKAPFGSFEIADTVNIDERNNYIDLVAKAISNIGGNKIIVKQPPACYSRVQEVEQLLTESLFREEVAEINQHLIVDNNSFSDKINQKERNKLNRAKAEGYHFKILDASHLENIYNLVLATHNRKGFPVTMELNELRKALSAVPDRYILFGLFDKSTLIAAITSIKVSSNVLYNFFHADLESYRSRSPLVMLIGEAYRFCQNTGTSILDLGISSVDGEINKGLFRFKENLGAKISMKKTFSLDL